ncbi:MAG: class I SAM-dependent methyltransferase [Rubrivivax sp.]|nr:class I SAM-dependent methyltransferase [Rubrivivax sp.]
MAQYYAQRADSYERIYHKPERQDDLRWIEAWLAETMRGRRVLELAAGTGWWTLHGARQAQDWLATDLNAETLAVARHKPMPRCVRFALADAYTLTCADGEPLRSSTVAAGGFDTVFAGFWWSHVPLSRLQPWLQALQAILPSGARVVFLDNRYVAGSSTPISRHDDEGNTYQWRMLDDGTRHEVLKNFPTREQAQASLGARAQQLQWLERPHYWLLSAVCGPSSAPASRVP